MECEGCRLGFHSPQVHEVTPDTIESTMFRIEGLLRRHPTNEAVDEGYAEGLLFGQERDLLKLIINYLTPR